MRVVWKDSMVANTCKPTTYRKHNVEWYVSPSRLIKGWIIGIPNDDNVYHSLHSAYNAIDAVLGGMPRRTCEKRQKKGIRIVGKIEK